MTALINTGLLALASLLLLSHQARAQIIPTNGTLVYDARDAKEASWPRLVVRAANGSPAYVLMLQPDSASDRGVGHIDVVMQRPDAKPDASNLLEPSYRWHGLQKYMFNALEFAPDYEDRGFGAARDIKIARRKLDVAFSVAKVKIRRTDESSPDGEYVFEKLALDVRIENAK